MASATLRDTDCAGVLLTGMGRDGAEGLLQLRRVGARTFGRVLNMLETCAQSMQSLDSVVRQVQEIQGKPEFDDDFSLLEFRFF